MSERLYWTKLLNSIGIDTFPKKRGLNFTDTPVYNIETGKRMTVSQAQRHEMAKDADGNIMANPYAKNIVDYPIMPTPIGNVVETGVNALGEVDPMTGVVAGVLSGRIPGQTLKAPSRFNPYDNAYNSYNNYKKINGYKKSSYELQSYTDDYAGPPRAETVKRVKTDKETIVKFKDKGPSTAPIMVIDHKDIPRVQQTLNNPASKVPEGTLPSITSDGMGITGLPPKEVTRILKERYGKNAIDPYFEGPTEKWDNTGLGFMRGRDNAYFDPETGRPFPEVAGDRNRGRMHFSKTTSNIDIDIHDPEHADLFVTAKDHGEGLMHLQDVSKRLGNMPIAVFASPGGVSGVPLDAHFYKQMLGPEGPRKQFELLARAKGDPAFMNFEMEKYANAMNDIWEGLPHKELSRYNPERHKFFAQPVMKHEAGKPVINPKTGKFFMKFGTAEPWIPPGRHFPEIQENWSRLQKGDNPFNEKSLFWRNIKDVPQSMMHDWINQYGGMMTNLRHSAKPSRLDNLRLKRHGFRPTISKDGYFQEGPMLGPPFVRQWMMNVGDMNKAGVKAMNRVFGPQGLIDVVDQTRYAQNIQDAVRPEMGRGLLDSQYLNDFMKSFSNKAQETIRKNWRLGLVPPLLQNNEEDE